MIFTSRRSNRRLALEHLEEKINFAAVIAGVDVTGTDWTAEFFPAGEEAWLPLMDGDQEDRSVGYAGIDKIRIRFTEPVMAGTSDGAITLVSHDQVIGGDLGESIQIASDGRSAVWDLPAVATEKVFALRTRPDGFRDADEAVNVDSLLFEFDVLPGDTNGDRAVLFEDFLALSARFGASGVGLAEDFLPNGSVEFADFLLLSANFSKDLGDGAITEQALVSGEVATGNLETGDIQLFSIEAEAGDRIFVTFGESVGTGLFNPGVFLYSPNGTLLTSVDTTTFGAAITDFEATESGAYTVLIRDTAADAAGEFTISAVVVDDAVDTGNVMLSSGETVAGSLALGEIDTLTFEAEAGEALFLTFSESVGIGQFNPGLFVYAPNGELIDSIEATTFGYAISDLDLPQTGTYTVVVRDASGDFFGDYLITTVIVDETVDVGNTELASGETVAGTLELGQIDTLTFAADAGETLFLTFSESVGTGLFNPGVFVYAPNGELIDSVASTTFGHAVTNFVLPQSGTYTVVVRDASGDFFGDYLITTVLVDETIDVGTTELTSGETIAGTLELGGIDTLTFAAEAGETLFLTFSESVGTGQFNPGLFVYAPHGELIDSVASTTFGHAVTNFVLPQSGTYTVVVRDASGDFFGDYLMTTVIVNQTIDVGNTELNSGETIAGTLELGEIDTLTFAAEAGETLFLTFSESVGTGQFNPGVFVYAPSGELIDSVAATTFGFEITNRVLPESGVYTVVLRDATGDFFGDYSMTAVVVDETVDADNAVLMVGDMIAGTLEIGDIDTFTFVANANGTRSVVFSDSVNTGVFNPGVFVHAPDGSLLSHVNASASGITLENLVMPVSGTYTIVVRDASADQGGDYSIQLIA